MKFSYDGPLSILEAIGMVAVGVVIGTLFAGAFILIVMGPATLLGR